MSDTSQINIPPSFVALFVLPGSGKLSATKEAIAARYELCEDLAQMLTETASTLQFQLGITESDVMERMGQGLGGDAAVVDAHEAQWVLCRLSELLGWSWSPSPMQQR